MVDDYVIFYPASGAWNFGYPPAIIALVWFTKYHMRELSPGYFYYLFVGVKSNILMRYFHMMTFCSRIGICI